MFIRMSSPVTGRRAPRRVSGGLGALDECVVDGGHVLPPQRAVGCGVTPGGEPVERLFDGGGRIRGQQHIGDAVVEDGVQDHGSGPVRVQLGILGASWVP